MLGDHKEFALTPTYSRTTFQIAIASTADTHGKVSQTHTVHLDRILNPNVISIKVDHLHCIGKRNRVRAQ